MPYKPIQCTGRWHFLDGETCEEADLKSQANEQIDKFWTDFKASAICRDPKKTVDDLSTVQWMVEHLPVASPKLEWEIGFSHDDKYELAICSGGMAQMPVVETIVERAGQIPGWEVTTYRLPIDPLQLNICDGFFSRTGTKLPIFSYELEVSRGRAINIKVLSPEFVGTNRNEDVGTAMLLCDMLLGENNVNKWIYFIQAEASDLIVTNFDFTKAAAAFAIDFGELKQLLLAALPETPPSLCDPTKGINVLGYPPEAMAEMEKLERCRFTCLTPWPEIMLALMSGESFYSERFFKSGEKFAYLHLVTDESTWTEEVREKFENALNQTLQENNKGSLISIGRGKDHHYYYDIALTKVREAIPVLRKFCQSQNLLSNRCWLRFVILTGIVSGSECYQTALI